MYLLNKLVWFLLNPSTLFLAGGAASLALLLRNGGRLHRLGFTLLAAVFAAFWFLSTPAAVCLLGLPLERPFLDRQRAEAAPEAGAIVVLGGGIGKKEKMTYPEMYDGADRLWHAARLYRAGKAPVVVVSGKNDLAAAVPLLLDLGIPRSAIAVDDESRNTYENSRFTARLLADMNAGTNRLDALVVSSAWHLPRALGNFAKTSLRVAPAPADFKAHDVFHGIEYPWQFLSPSPDCLALSSVFLKEWLGRLARR